MPSSRATMSRQGIYPVYSHASSMPHHELAISAWALLPGGKANCSGMAVEGTGILIFMQRSGLGLRV